MFKSDVSKIIAELKSSYGEVFFNKLTIQLNKIIKADYTFIARLDHKRQVSRTISLVANGRVLENFEYSLKHTPCSDVSQDKTCLYPKEITKKFPKDQLLIDMKIEGYIGVPLHNSAGKVMGLLVALYEQPIEDSGVVSDLFNLFSGRISAEMERNEKEAELEELNRTLEDKVEQRTLELTDALENLKATQAQIIEHEKLASLGQLVAGVAHEINTPLGVAILGASTSQELIHDLQECVASGKLTKTKLEETLAALLEADETLEFNLKRAAELVKNFKQVAVEHNTDQRTVMSLNEWLQTLLTSLRPMMRKHGIALELDLPDKEHRVISYPSKLSQLLTNLLSNAALHAFPEEFDARDKQVTIALSCLDKEIELSVRDNGVGMDKETKEHILEPFYTTRRGKGGTGLGMSIVNSIVTEQLNGEIYIESTLGEGSTVSIVFPPYEGEEVLDPNLD